MRIFGLALVALTLVAVLPGIAASADGAPTAQAAKDKDEKKQKEPKGADSDGNTTRSADGDTERDDDEDVAANSAPQPQQPAAQAPKKSKPKQREAEVDTESDDDGEGSGAASGGRRTPVASQQPTPVTSAPATAPATAPARTGRRTTSNRRGSSTGSRARDRRSAGPAASVLGAAGTSPRPALAPIGDSRVLSTRGGERPAIRRLGRVGLVATAGDPPPVSDDPKLGGLPAAVGDAAAALPVPFRLGLVILAALALFFGLWSVIASLRARRLARQRAQLLDEVGLLQAALLPAVPDRLGPLVSTVAYRPAEGLAAGGDFYDAFAFDGGRIGLIVGDVAGHGRDALARTALMRYTLRAYLDAGLEPRAALKVAGGVLDDDLGTEFATVVLAVYDPEAGTLTYASAGHPPPILLGPPAHDPVTVSSSPPIGTGATTGLRQTTVSLPAGSTACFFTDGMIEARIGDDLLGRERLAALLAELGPDATAEQLLEEVSRTADRTPDDMAACIIRADAGARGAGVRVEELEVAANDLGSGTLDRFLRAAGVPADELPGVRREARSAIQTAGSAVIRVRAGDFRPGVDVLPGHVETIVASRRDVAHAL
ncbi:MAG TPA: PP2C family protein-serine/threonine phosphatase [Thermoleophilaceae bacterium]|nr:PP2C family protein-serine/threonine phosphatase [Thermoleophilaceae bacterium]